jgi:hypothetical protein
MNVWEHTDHQAASATTPLATMVGRRKQGERRKEMARCRLHLAALLPLHCTSAARKQPTNREEYKEEAHNSFTSTTSQKGSHSNCSPKTDSGKRAQRR